MCLNGVGLSKKSGTSRLCGGSWGCHKVYIGSEGYTGLQVRIQLGEEVLRGQVEQIGDSCVHLGLLFLLPI